MGQNIYQFIDVQRVEPPKKLKALRTKGFGEIYLPFSKEQAQAQADRCLSCGNPYCEWKCPVHNYIPQWLKLANEGRILEAADLCHQTNSLPEICGRVCPQDRLCEGSCTLNEQYGAVTIGNLEKYINDQAFALGWKPDLSHVTPLNKKVAIIGAGPAGLSCADVLARNGIYADVYDRHPEIGGLLTYGIPSFKLEKSLMASRRTLFENMGIVFHLEVDIGSDITITQLEEQYDAIFVAVGTYQSIKANIVNENAQGVYEALPYLIANNYHVMNDHPYPSIPKSIPKPINLSGQKVIVLGGGDTAMDCVRTAIRQQAAEVTCVYRRDKENMPGSKKETQNALEEGVHFLFNLQPISIEVINDKVTGIRVVQTELGDPDENGRRRPKSIAGSEQVLTADAIIIAFGFQAHSMPWLQSHHVKLNQWGLIEIGSDKKSKWQTENPKIFAGGDVVSGSDLVVTAIAQGRDAALDILNFLC